MILQLCGLSGAGKTTLARNLKTHLQQHGVEAEIVDGDEYRKVLCKDLGFSEEDRCENIRRLGFVASRLSAHGVVTIISAINPYQEMRDEMATLYPKVKTVFVDCDLSRLMDRDTKGLYKKALLPEGHPDRLSNLTGVNDRFDVPVMPDLYINTATTTVEDCTRELLDFVLQQLHSSVYLFRKQQAQRYS